MTTLGKDIFTLSTDILVLRSIPLNLYCTKIQTVLRTGRKGTAVPTSHSKGKRGAGND